MGARLGGSTFLMPNPHGIYASSAYSPEIIDAPIYCPDCGLELLNLAEGYGQISSPLKPKPSLLKKILIWCGWPVFVPPEETRFQKLTYHVCGKCKKLIERHGPFSPSIHASTAFNPNWSWSSQQDGPTTFKTLGTITDEALSRLIASALKD